MRNLLASVVAFAAVVAGIVLTGGWCYWIWSFDWGRFGSRGYGLWGMAFYFGGVVVFLVALFVAMTLHAWLFVAKE